MRTTSDACLRPVHAGDPPAPEPVQDGALLSLVRTPWTLRVGTTPLIVRPSSARDLAAVAQLHSRCSARTLLNRYRSGGRPPAIAALDTALREPLGVVAARADGTVVATGTVRRDRGHHHLCAEVGVLVDDAWQRLGIGTELVSHLAGVAQVSGYHELIAYPATAVLPVQRLMLGVGRTRMVPDRDPHLHTYLPESATLGLGSVRQRLAG